MTVQAAGLQYIGMRNEQAVSVLTLQLGQSPSSTFLVNKLRRVQGADFYLFRTLVHHALDWARELHAHLWGRCVVVIFLVQAQSRR